MDSSDIERNHIIDVKSRDVDIPQLASSTSNSSGSRTRCGSDGTCGSGESMNTSSREDSSDNTSLGDDEGGNDADGSNASETKIANVDFDDEHGSHNNHDVGRLIIRGDHEDGEVSDTSAHALVRIGQMGPKTAQKIDDAMEISAVKHVSHLIRSVEIDALCLWDGDDQNGPVTDTRITMVVCIMISLLLL